MREADDDVLSTVVFVAALAFVVFLSALFWLEGCAPSTVESYGARYVSTPPIDIGDPIVECGNACERMRDLSCPEAVSNLGGNSCLVTCLQTTRIRVMPVACWAHAEDVAALRACGSIACSR